MKKIIVVFVVVIILLGYFLHPTLFFIVNDVNDNKILYINEIKPGFKFATKIRHSVQKTPVFEYYVVEKDGSLLVTSTALQDLGWGMPSNLEHKVEFQDNFMIMDQINRKINVLPFRISYIAEPCLIIDDYILDLQKFSQDGNLIEVYAKKMPFFLGIIRREINDF